jgi:hypothetical protein
VSSPYRGMMVFHGPGSGKAFAAVEGLRARRARDREFLLLLASQRGTSGTSMSMCWSSGLLPLGG